MKNFLKRFRKSIVILVVTLTLFLLSYLLTTFCTQSKILYSFMPDPSSGENLSFMFYEASLDSPLELKQIGAASPGKMPGRDMLLFQKDDGRLYGAVTNYDLAQGIEAIIYSGYAPSDFTAHYVNLGIRKLSGASNKSPKKVWAPEFFEDSDGLTYLFSAANDVDDMVDKDGAVIPRHSIYRIKINLDDFNTMETVQVHLKVRMSIKRPLITINQKI